MTFHVEHSVQTSEDRIPRDLQIRSVLTKNGLRLDDRQWRSLERFSELLLDWNQRINLLSRRDAGLIWEHHILHSLAPLFFISFRKLNCIVDAGTGGGLPGVPLAIALPDVRFVLVDSIEKKTKAVRAMAENLRLENVTVIRSRLEEMKNTDGGEADGVITRAFAPLCDILRWTKHLLAPVTEGEEKDADGKLVIPPGSLIVLKGGDVTDEINQARRIAPRIAVNEIALTFRGSEMLSANDKKILIINPGKKVNA